MDKTLDSSFVSKWNGAHLWSDTLPVGISHPAAKWSKSIVVIIVQGTRDITDGVPTRVDGLHEAFVCCLNQLLCFFIHISNKESFIEVSMEAIVVDRDVNCEEQWKRWCNVSQWLWTQAWMMIRVYFPRWPSHHALSSLTTNWEVYRWGCLPPAVVFCLGFHGRWPHWQMYSTIWESYNSWGGRGNSSSLYRPENARHAG